MPDWKSIGKTLGVVITEEEWEHRKQVALAYEQEAASAREHPELARERAQLAREQAELAREQAKLTKRISLTVRCEYAGSTFPADELRKGFLKKVLSVSLDGIAIQPSQPTLMIPWEEIVGITVDDETFMKIKSSWSAWSILSHDTLLETSSKQKKQCFMTIGTVQGDLLLRIFGHSANDMRGRLAASQHLWDKQPPPSREQPAPSQSEAAPSPDKSLGEELERLVGLHERGTLTDDEFARLKANVLKQLD